MYKTIFLCEVIYNNYLYRGARPVAASGKPTANTKTVAFDLPPWQNQPTENGDIKTEVSSYSYILNIIKEKKVNKNLFIII